MAAKKSGKGRKSSRGKAKPKKSARKSAKKPARKKVVKKAARRSAKKAPRPKAKAAKKAAKPAPKAKAKPQPKKPAAPKPAAKPKKALSSFLAKMSADPALQDQYRRDPDGVMRSHGLSDHEISLMHGTEEGPIHEYLGPDGPPGGLILVSSS